MDKAAVDIYIDQLRIKHGVLVANSEDDFILGMNQCCVESKLIRLIAGQIDRENAETIVAVRIEVKFGFALGIIQSPLTPKNILIIAIALLNIDHDIFVLVANVFPKSMNIKSGEVFAVCEPVTKIFHHKNVCDNSNEEVKRKLEIPALELGHLTDH